MGLDFVRYLASKKSIDDRALNKDVWARFASLIPPRPLRTLELGAGIGTMVERLAAHDVLLRGEYTLLDEQPGNIAAAERRLHNVPALFELKPLCADALAHVDAHTGHYDVLIAHAFLDLFALDDAVPRVLRALKPGGIFYFTINFDGVTLFEPQLDAALDALLEAKYHASMDERITHGVRSGDSRSGRHLFGVLRNAGARILAAGASDWVVFADPHGRYPADEAFFLQCILGFFEDSLSRRNDVDQAALACWLAARRQQIARGELVYIAHQLDFVGLS